MEKCPRQAFVGMGANLGDRAATLAAATARLQALPGISALESSSVYETDPVGEIAQPMFLNLVVGVETTLRPEALLDALMDIERVFGRVRVERWGPRTLDLDLLAYEGESRATAVLDLPHPRMLERAFVVVPLRELMERPRFRIAAWATLRAQLVLPIGQDGIRHFSALQSRPHWLSSREAPREGRSRSVEGH
jgi:2-amino-4-hydroxy-6-hydroxymethyldihydropteridine diphosphokinase